MAELMNTTKGEGKWINFFLTLLKSERWDLNRGVFQESLQSGPDYLATVLPCYNLSQSTTRLGKQ